MDKTKTEPSLDAIHTYQRGLPAEIRFAYDAAWAHEWALERNKRLGWTERHEAAHRAGRKAVE